MWKTIPYHCPVSGSLCPPAHYLQENQLFLWTRNSWQLGEKDLIRH